MDIERKRIARLEQALQVSISCINVMARELAKTGYSESVKAAHELIRRLEAVRNDRPPKLLQ